MSKLYASIDSDASRTEATRRGHRRISTHTRGWDIGVRVEAGLDMNGSEVFEVYVTAGSNGGARDDLIGRVTLHDGNRSFFPAYVGKTSRHDSGRRIASEEGVTA